jgi:enoyl-CoA hydratase
MKHIEPGGTTTGAGQPVTSSVVVETCADYRVATLCRPDKRNAIDAQMVEELHAVCEESEKDPKILILIGAGSTFASGADLRQMRARTHSDALAGINSALFARIQRLPMPVIAAVDGWALGGGAELAYAADFRIATPRAIFGNPEVRLGIAPAAGACWRLVELVGEQLAKSMLLADVRLDGDEALAAGLVCQIVAPEELLTAARALASRIAHGAPLAVRLTKTLIHAPRTAHPLIDDLAQAVLFDRPEKGERMTAFLEKNHARNP